MSTKTSTKNFILDTNVLLHDPQAIHGFGDNMVCVPIVVIEEIDTFKKSANELGRNAREVSRLIDALRDMGNLTDGIPLPHGGAFRVVVTDRELPHGFRISHQADNRIMATALHVKESEPEKAAIFVTLDTNLRIRANALGLEAVDYDADKITLDELYPGTTECDTEPGTVAALYEDKEIALPPSTNGAWLENQYVLVKDERGSALARVRLQEERLELTRQFKEDLIWGIRPRNREQHFALDACLQDDIRLVSLIGKAGTGKTLMALAAALHKVAEEGRYQRVMVSRPVMPLGRDLGFLPGDVEEKLKPWMQPIHDNVEFLLGLTQKDKRAGRGVNDLVGQGLMEVEPLTYIRGRSLPNQYMIIDEAQNLTPHEVKTILTRAGDGTKVVLTGDPYQIDHPYVDSISNGLTYLVEHFKGQRIAATVTLRKGERSELAELASNVL